MEFLKNLKGVLKAILRDPFIYATGIGLAFLALVLIKESGFAGWLASGALAKAFTGLLALCFALISVRCASLLTLTLTDKEASDVGSNPIARAILSAGIYVFAGCLALAVFG